MKILKQIYYSFTHRLTQAIAHFIPLNINNLYFDTKKALLNGRQLIDRGLVEGNVEPFAIHPKVKLTKSENAKIVLKKTPFNKLVKPLNPDIIGGISIGVEWSPRFIPFSANRQSIIELKRECPS